MLDRRHSFFTLLVSLSLAIAPPAIATDTDGPDDCLRDAHDYADAPEMVQAYPGIPGAFPTCIMPGPLGTQSLATTAISTSPGPAGFVHHIVMPSMPPFWLGCALGPPRGLDGEIDGKTNDIGAPNSVCQPSQPVDCFESAFGLTFGQDECYGSTDAGLGAALKFSTCQFTSFTFATYNCAPTEREVYLNVCLDMDQDGDWNDNFPCPNGQFAFEWVVKNAPVLLAPGCAMQSTPSFLVGPNPGYAWMRVTLTQAPVPDDYPWNGSAGMTGEAFLNGETEDYPVTLTGGDLCPDYSDFGDAPDDFGTYASGIVGNFPTCIFAGLVGTQSIACPPISTAPQSTGYVEHRGSINDPQMVWLGCTPAALDGEIDGKSNLFGGGAPSICNQTVTTDCSELTPWGTTAGQDECYGDIDAGVVGPVQFETCQPETIRYSLFNCRAGDALVYLNVLVDWDEDADWNDNFMCAGNVCVYEWVIKNQTITVPPGCTQTTFIVPNAGPFAGHGWMRVSVSNQPVNDDFPWAGSATMQPAYLVGGETEDYPVTIVEPPPCSVAYTDLGDAPEGFPAYPGGPPAQFPTCTPFMGTIGTWEDYCAVPTPAPALTPTGFVQHVTGANDPFAFWLGCGTAGVPQAGRDGELDGKTSDFLLGGTASFCNPSVPVDCVESAFGMQFGQDECYGDADAGLASTISLQTCVPNTIAFQTYSCAVMLQSVYLNILVDMNRDGDWNDRMSCPGTPPASCPWEWAVQNALVTLPPGCATVNSPPFLVGARDGMAWMRITLSEQPAPPDFPWNGTVSLPGSAFTRGETEDYPLEIALGPTGAARALPERLWMGPLVPNPARGSTVARFALPATASVDLAAYDVGGRRVRALFAGSMSAGDHAMRWDFMDDSGRPVPAGIYLVRLQTPDGVLVRRAIRIE